MLLEGCKIHTRQIRRIGSLKNSAGRDSVVPYNISPQVSPKSSLNVEGRPKSTMSRDYVHRVGLWHFKACLRVQWERSTKTLLAGWYGDVMMRRVPRIRLKEMKRCDSNCRLWSVVRIFGTQNLKIQCMTNVRAKMCMCRAKYDKCPSHVLLLASGKNGLWISPRTHSHLMEVRIQPCQDRHARISVM